MAVVANPLVLRIFINSTLTGRSCGWAERWPLLETDWNTALGVALAMVQARQNVLSSNAYIQWACVGTVSPPYYEQTVVTDPLYPLPQWGPAAFDMQGILFTLATSAGENAPHLFRAVEGTEISAKRWIYQDMAVPLVPPALPVDLATAPKDVLWQNTLATFRKYAATQQPMSDGHHGEGDGYWVEGFAVMAYRQVGSRRWGPAWRRMSWEAAPFVNAPQFSPCGCVVTVNRISYAIPCRFGPDWSLRWIHYYDAIPDATVMTFSTPFCCWDRSKEYDDFSGVGEAQNFLQRNWTNGSSWGSAPGVMWTGPESYFEGFAPEPPIPTPGFMRPACDAPAAPPGQIAPGGAGGGGVGIKCAVVPAPPSPVPWFPAMLISLPAAADAQIAVGHSLDVIFESTTPPPVLPTLTQAPAGSVPSPQDPRDAKKTQAIDFPVWVPPLLQRAAATPEAPRPIKPLPMILQPADIFVDRKNLVVAAEPPRAASGTLPVFAPAAAAGIVHVQDANLAETSTAVTSVTCVLVGEPVVGNYIIVYGWAFYGGPGGPLAGNITCSDGTGMNVYTQQEFKTDSTQGCSFIFYCKVAHTAPGFSVKISVGSGQLWFLSLGASEFSGINATTPVFGSGASSGIGTPATSGSLAVGAGNLVVAALEWNENSSVTWVSPVGWTQPDMAIDNGTNDPSENFHYGQALYQIGPTSPSSVSWVVVGTTATSDKWSVSQVAFQP